MAAAKKKDHWIGFDLGGTKMLACVYGNDFVVKGRKRKKTKAHIGAEAGLQRMIKTINEALVDAGVAPDRLAGIGIGCPGPLDLDRGIVLETPNMGWKNVPVAKVIRAAFNCPVVIANDVDAGVYGEYRFGAARGARCVVGVFPGTGIGGGCVYEGSIIRGKIGSCMEIGHLPVTADGPLCGCGRRGCLETYAARPAIAAACAAAARRGEAPRLMEAADGDMNDIRSGAIAASIRAGDAAVERIVREAARRIGWSMAGVVNLLAPDVVLLGGGLVEAMPDIFRSEIESAIKARVMSSMEGIFKVAVAELGGDAGVTGMAAWAEYIVENRGDGS
ncbi:MAG: transcriptional regulator [Rhodospirillales bacterium RIFCSPLOWO2_12_FULL_58_28]|nr:MAG: transcriptional regulator [Rhodospirillales bacterium RIFCSPLOWO2_02_FULL_58_16]OHC77334.1 MAG: transcriptional regulator [Rhodospirillales bacterium RIFCSPLOWO2_12_FULL_58_28]